MALLYSAALAGFIKYLDKVAILVVNTPMLARFPAQLLRHSPRRNSFPCISLPPLSCPEPRRAHSQKSQTLCNQANPVSFCKTPGVGYTLTSRPRRISNQHPLLCVASAPSASRRYPYSAHLPCDELEKRAAPAPTTFRINTCKSVSKQRTLSPSRMNTYEKTGEGGPPLLPIRHRLFWCGLLLGRCLYLVR
jgi:hypothetical protein